MAPEQRMPCWFLKPLPPAEQLHKVGGILSRLRLRSVCQSARCPNLGVCFAAGTAAFMLMGDICTRSCRFCAVTGGNPWPLEAGEPARVAQAVKELDLSHAVVTSVTRDDLSDGGAQHFARTITAIRTGSMSTTVEVLVPDFAGSAEAIKVIAAAKPDIFNHNLETVPRLYRDVRPQANYHRSLALLKTAKSLDRDLLTKSGMMLGLGEDEEELLTAMRDLRRAGCDLLTLGQYLRPSEQHLPVKRYIPPAEFARLADRGKEMGFRGVAAGPFIRSSYRAAELFQARPRL